MKPNTKTKFTVAFAIVLLPLLMVPFGCKDETTLAPPALTVLPSLELPGDVPAGPANKITGTVEIVFKGGNGNDPNEHDGEKRAFADISAHEPVADRPGMGTFTYSVVGAEDVVHRQIVVSLEGAWTDAVASKAWYVGTVVSDTKGCAGNGGGGHEPGCPGGDCGDDHDHVEGGCSGTDGSCGADHDHVEGGCSGTDGGCSDDHDHVDGGCSGTDGSCGSDHDHVDGGCSGSDGHDGGHDGGCSGGGGSSGGGCSGNSGGSGSTHVNGRSCRVGQVLVGRAHDGGTPAIRGDGITWKWFDANDPQLPTLDDITAWPHLCKKTILGGNIVVHTNDGKDVHVRNE